MRTISLCHEVSETLTLVIGNICRTLGFDILNMLGEGKELCDFITHLARLEERDTVSIMDEFSECHISVLDLFFTKVGAVDSGCLGSQSISKGSKREGVHAHS